MSPTLRAQRLTSAASQPARPHVTRTTWKRAARTLLLVTTAPLLASCGGSDPIKPPEEGGPSSFSATLAGTVDGNYQGTAVFASAGIAGFAIVLATNTPGQDIQINFSRASSAPPAQQQYPLFDMTDPDPEPEATPSDFVVRVNLATTGASGSLISKSGTLTITEVSGVRIAGTFQFSAEGPPGANGVPLQVTGNGSFIAINAAP